MRANPFQVRDGKLIVDLMAYEADEKPHWLSGANTLPQAKRETIRQRHREEWLQRKQKVMSS